MAPVTGRDKWVWERGHGVLQLLECCAEGLGLCPEGSRAEGLAQSLKCPEGRREPVAVLEPSPWCLSYLPLLHQEFFIAQKFMERP